MVYMKATTKYPCLRIWRSDESQLTCHGFLSFNQFATASMMFYKRDHDQEEARNYVSLLKNYGASKSLLEGRRLHQHIMKEGHVPNMFLGYQILQMYGSCGSIEDAQSWFVEMQRHHINIWNYMMSLNSKLGRSSDALLLFSQMLQEGIICDKITFIVLISVCTSLSQIVDGKQLHARLIGSGYESQVVVVTALVNLYGKCGIHDRAHDLFDAMPRRDTITWNALISGYKHHKKGKEALQLFDQMHMEGVLSSRATFACTLSACANQVSLCQGKRMHVYTVQTGFESQFVISNALVRMYSQCGSLEDAEQLFNSLSGVNADASNAMIAAYARYGCLNESIDLLSRMQYEGVPVDMVIYMYMLDVCGTRGALDEGKQMHYYIKRSGYAEKTMIGNALTTMYGRCQSLEHALTAFESIPYKDIVSWNAVITACGQNGNCKKAIQMFDQMHQVGLIPNKVTFVCVIDAFASKEDLFENSKWFVSHVLVSATDLEVMVATSIVNMYGKTGSLLDAKIILDSITEPNEVSWTAMISSCSLHGYESETRQLFNHMLQQGLLPDMVTYLNIIVAYTSLAALSEGKMIHVLLKHGGFELHTPVANALINLYSKCGCLADACNVFDIFPSRNLATWNIMISTYAQHGLGIEAIGFLSKMHQAGIFPDKVTFVAYLSACSHAGIIDEAFYCLLHVCDVFGIRPSLEHYDCIVDMLGRAGQSCEAESVIDFISLQPTALSWMTLLTTYRNLLDVEGGERSAKHVIETDPGDHVPYIMLANIYAAIGRQEEADVLLRMFDDQELISEENCVYQALSGLG